jgi:predicted nucleic acid-binding protein
LNLVLDSSSTINLQNGDTLEVVLKLASTTFRFHMGTIVRGECRELTPLLDEQVKKGLLAILPGKTLTATRFAEILYLYELGLGETECIAHAEQRSLVVCTDDKAARKAAGAHLGQDRVVGSLRLMRETVCAGNIDPHQAYIAYEQMKVRGAFLPEITADYFDC